MKVFLVEDEYVIREGIKNNIDWEGNGYTFIGEAGDGELALPLIAKTMPDIVVTDIKMPFMDGLELSRILKSKYPNMEIIILSGYDEFDYAKQGISIGVAQYLLKPISGADLLKAIDEVKERILDKRKELVLYERYQQETEENRLNEKKQFFIDLVKSSAPLSDMIERAKKLDMDITAIWYNVVLFKSISVNHEEGEYSGSVEEVSGKLSELVKDRSILLFDRGLEGKALIFMGDTEKEIEELQKNLFDELKAYMETFSQIHYFAGLGNPVNRIRELSSSYESASRAFAHRYLLGSNMIVSCDDIKQVPHAKSENLDLSQVDTEKIDIAKINDFLKTGDLDEARFFVEEYFNDLGSALKSQLFRQYIVMNCYFAVTKFLESLNESKDIVGDASAIERLAGGNEETVNYVTDIISKAINVRESKASDKLGNLVGKVKEIIDKDYCDADLSLKVIASKVNFSPNHLSMLFSHETGQTLIKYLTDQRLNKAKELLRCTSLKSSEIAEKVGYSDPHYFSYLFKKTYSITPTQYREGKEI